MKPIKEHLESVTEGGLDDGQDNKMVYYQGPIVLISLFAVTSRWLFQLLSKE